MASREPLPRVLNPSASESIEPHVLRERITEEFAELDAREGEIARKRLELKRLWNSSLLIYKLPNELLVQIFAEFQDDIRTSYAHWMPSRQRLSMGWPALMLVCSQWRDILISTPAFWRSIELRRSVDWMKICLSRSAQASIDVIGGHQDHCYFNMLSSHAHRFRTFALDIRYFQELPAAISVLFSDHRSFMEVLRFSVFETTPSDIDFQLTSQRFPRLQTVELASVVAPQDMSLFAQLRILSLSHCPHHLSVDAFLDALTACIHLEELDLNATLNHLSGEWTQARPVPWRPPISLPRLRRLTLAGHRPVHTSRFLAHVHLQPSMARLWLSALSSSHPHSTATSLSAMLPPTPSATLAVLGAICQARLTVVGDTYEIRADGACLDEFAPAATTPERCPQATLSLWPGVDAGPGDPNWDWYLSQGLDDLAAAFAHAPLRRLAVDGNHRYGTAAAWARMFRTCALLEELDVCGQPGTDVSSVFLGLHAASETAARGADPSGPPLACPGLKRVRVDGVGTAEAYEAARECFRYRADRGVVLPFLSLALWEDPEVDPEMRHACIVELGNAVERIRVGHDGENDGDTQS